MTDVTTTQAAALLRANTCSPAVATMLGLVFAERDVELIDHLKTLETLPQPSEFPPAQTLADALAVDLRTSAFVREKVLRFLHKRRINGDFTEDVQAFIQRAEVRALLPACRNLKPGTTVFIGDSLMDIRHFSANASFPILAGTFLQSLRVGPYLNAGIGGQTSAQGLARFQKDVIAHGAVRVVLSFGSNDLANGVPVERIINNFEAMISQSQAIGADVVVGLLLPVVTERLWWCRDTLRNVTLQERRPLQQAMLELAKRNGLACFDLLDVMKPEHYCVDGIHINQAGQELLGIETLKLLTTPR